MAWVEEFLLDISGYSQHDLNQIIRRYGNEGWKFVAIEGHYAHFQKQHG